MLKFYDITGNEHALQHIINQLEEGRTLSAKVRTNVDFRRGALLAALPENIKPSPSLNFAECLPLRFEPNYLPDVAAIIKEFIVGHIHAVLIQDDLSSTQDEELQAYLGQNHALCYKDEVYWQLVGPDVSDEDVAAILDEATQFPFSAFFYMPRRESCVDLSDADLDNIINTLAGVAVGAFDEDSFLLWWDNRVPLPVTIESP